MRQTVLATILTILRAGEGDGWCVRSSGALAVRSSPVTPIALTAGWDDVDPLVAVLAGLVSVTAITGPVEVVDTVTSRLAQRTGASMHRMAIRLFRLDDLAMPGVAGTTRMASPSDRSLLRDWYAAFGAEARDMVAGTESAVDQALAWGRVWLWTDDAGEPVSLAARRSPNAGVARVGPGVYPVGASRAWLSIGGDGRCDRGHPRR